MFRINKQRNGYLILSNCYIKNKNDMCQPLTVTIIVLCAVLDSIAQEPITKCRYLRNDIDDLTGKRTIQTAYYKIAKTKRGSSTVAASFRKVDDELFLEIYNTDTDLGCISVDSELILKTVSGKLLSMKHIGGRNCDWIQMRGYRTPPTLVLPVSPTNEAIKTDAIEMVRFTYERRSDDATLYFPLGLKQICDCVSSAPEPKVKKSKRQKA
jgi:hypothetical protein